MIVSCRVMHSHLPAITQAWRCRDMLKFIVVLLLQPCLIDLSTAPSRDPSVQMRGFWPDAPPSAASPRMFFYAASEVASLYVLWFCLRRMAPISGRELLELRIIGSEWLQAMKATFSEFSATIKTHKMDHVAEATEDLGSGLLYDEQAGEHAHKLMILLYALVTNRSEGDFTQQLAAARNRQVAAIILHDQEGRAPEPQRYCQETVLFQAVREGPQLLRLCLNDHWQVVDAELADASVDLPVGALLHLYWALFCFLMQPTEQHDETSMDLVPSLTCLDLRHGVHLEAHNEKAIIQSHLTCSVANGSSNPGPFVAVEAGADGIYYGQVLLFFSVTAVDGTQRSLAYIRWLTHSIDGGARAQVPLPNSFAVHQWEHSMMGVHQAHASRRIPLSQHFGVIDIKSILNVEHFVQIGDFKPRAGGVNAGLRAGPLLANNVHAWIATPACMLTPDGAQIQ